MIMADLLALISSKSPSHPLPRMALAFIKTEQLRGNGAKRKIHCIALRIELENAA